MEQARKRGILKGSKAARMNSNPISMNGGGDACSISSMHSISTQASVYAPTFNPTTKPPSSDWYDTINDSDTSTCDSNGRLTLMNVVSIKPMANIVEGISNQASNLPPTPPNLASNLAPIDSNLGSDLDNPLLVPSLPPLVDTNPTPPNLGANSNEPLSRYGSLQAKPSHEDNQGYFSDASSTNSSMRTRLAPRLYSHLSAHGRASHLEPSICEETPKMQSSSATVNLSFKERNFNFDFENISLTSTMGVQAFEDIYGQPSAPSASIHMSHPSYLNDTYQTHAHQYGGHMPHIIEQSTTSSEAQTPALASHIIDHQSNAQQYGGHDVPHIGQQSTTTSLVARHNIDYRLNSRRTSSTSGDSRELSLDDNNGIPMSSKARPLQNSSLSSSSLSTINHLEASPSKKANNLKVWPQNSLDQSGDLSSGEISSEGGERQGQSLGKNLTTGTKNTFLLCIPKGICIPEGNVRSICRSFIKDYDSMNVKDCVKSLWADTYQPTSFDAFLFHVQQAQLLRQLISQGNCPHIFFHGLSNYGKKLLIMVLLREIFGPIAWKVSQEKKEFKNKGEKKVPIQLVASKFHVEVDAEGLGENARTVLVGLFKEITQSMDSSRVIDNDVDYGINFKVIVLYGIEKLSSDTQQLIRFLMDRYGDTCKLLLYSDHADNVLDSIKSRCQIVVVDSPSQQEMVNVLQHIAEQEKMRVSLHFITRIANESNQNIRHAIESLEACKPSLQGRAPREDMPIPTGWEDVVAKIAKDILMEQTPKRMFLARNKLQSLLERHVPPQLILQSLAIELLQILNFHLEREICCLHGLYENRLLATSTASIDKLEEFVAKIMSIYKKYKKATLSEAK